MEHVSASAKGSEPVSSALVHVVAADVEVQQLLRRWLATAGIAARVYAHLGAFLAGRRVDATGCLFLDAQLPTIRGFEALAVLLPIAIRCPIVVAAAQTNLSMTASDYEKRAIGFVAKPLREQSVVSAISAAIEVDRMRRLRDSHRAELRARFATLTPRERQVMCGVTSGLLNKQIGTNLGVSEMTVKSHRGAAMRKMCARSLADLVRMADAIGEEAAPVKGDRLIRVPPVVAASRHTDCEWGRGKPAHDSPGLTLSGTSGQEYAGHRHDEDVLIALGTG